MTIPQNPLPAKKGTGKPQTPEQEKAAKRNFAIFQLKGMLGHLSHLHGQVPPERIVDLQSAIHSALATLAKPSDPAVAVPSDVPYLENWQLCIEVTTSQVFLRGAIFGSNKLADNTPVRTGYLAGANRTAGTVQTVSGSTYLLRGGDPKEFDRICLRFGV